MPFRRLENFLGKFSQTLSSRSHASENRIAEILKELFPSGRFVAKIKRKTLVISASATYQSEFFLRREEILEKFHEEMGDDSPKEISFRIL
ncbi:MAG: DciA family protein [bacterium]|nr:DciA family protein [bacterium]